MPCTLSFKELAVIIIYLIVGCLDNKERGIMWDWNYCMMPTLNLQNTLNNRPYPMDVLHLETIYVFWIGNGST